MYCASCNMVWGTLKYCSCSDGMLLQQDLNLSFDYPNPRTIAVTVLLKYFVTGVCFIRVVQ